MEGRPTVTGIVVSHCGDLPSLGLKLFRLAAASISVPSTGEVLVREQAAAGPVRPLRRRAAPDLCLSSARGFGEDGGSEARLIGSCRGTSGNSRL